MQHSALRNGLHALITLLFLTLVSLGCHSRPPAPGPSAPHWLSGHWVGQGFGGEMEEWWSDAKGDRLFGAFRLTRGEETVFYELFEVRMDSAGWVMSLRHFDPDLSGWEEGEGPLLWPATSVTPNFVAFGPVSYERLSSDSLRVRVAAGEGEPAEVIYRRIP